MAVNRVEIGRGSRARGRGFAVSGGVVGVALQQGGGAAIAHRGQATQGVIAVVAQRRILQRGVVQRRDTAHVVEDIAQ